MKTQYYKIFLLLIFCTAYSVLFAGATPSKPDTKSTATVNTFVRRVVKGGAPIQTIQSADGNYVSLSQTAPRAFLLQKIRNSGRIAWQRKVTVSTDIQGFAQTIDGGYILAGSDIETNGFGYYKVRTITGNLIKLNANGTIAWKKGFSVNNDHVYFNSVIPKEDGGFIVQGGVMLGSSGEFSLLLIRFTAGGDILWSKGLVDHVSTGDFRLIQTADNAMIAASPTEKGISLCKMNDSGTILWNKSLELPEFTVQTLAPTSDNGIILAGTNYNNLFLIRLRSDGKIARRAKFSLEGFCIRSISDLVQTLDGGYLLTGTLGEGIGNNPRGWFAKVNVDNSITVQKTFRFGQGRGGSIFATTNGTYFLIGGTNGRWSGDLLLLKINSEGVAAGCSLFGSIVFHFVPFGEMKVSKQSIGQPVSVALGIKDIVASSVVSRHPFLSVCPGQ